MSLSNPNLPVTEERLQEFYHKLLPYMGGGGAGGGHTIEDSEGTDLTQRDTLQFGEGFLAEDDDTNEKTVISPDVMQSGDMDDVITPLPSVAPKKEGIKYSTTEQVIGEWLDGKPLYQKTIEVNITTSTNQGANIYTGEISISTFFDFSTIDNMFFDIEHSFYALGNVRGFVYGWVLKEASAVLLGTLYARTDVPSKLTFQYTKVSDTPNT